MRRVKKTRKAIIAIAGSLVAIVSHYNPIIGDQIGDFVFVIDTALTPFLVYFVPNASEDP